MLAVESLVNASFLVEIVAPHMALGKDLDWIPKGVFSRGGGFAGNFSKRFRIS